MLPSITPKPRSTSLNPRFCSPSRYRTNVICDTKNILQTSRKNLALMKRDPFKVQNKFHNSSMASPSIRKDYSPITKLATLPLDKRVVDLRVAMKSNRVSQQILKKRLAANKTTLNSMWKSNNRSGGFTKNFLGRMYQDNSMNKELKRDITLERIQKKMGKIDTQRQLIQNDRYKRQKIIAFYKKNYNIKIKNTDIPIERLEEILCTKVTKQSQSKAALTIQTAFRKYIALKRFKMYIKRRLDAVMYIQRVWKRYRMISMIPKAWRKFKNKRILRIQKFMKGYIVHKRTFETLSKLKLTQNFEYFGQIRHKLYVNSQIKIRYYYLKWKKRIAMKKRASIRSATKNKKLKMTHKFNSFRKGAVVYKNPSIPASPAKLNLNSTQKGSIGSRKMTNLESPTIRPTEVENPDSPVIRMNPVGSLSSQKGIDSINEGEEE
ncbi:unnamed protein product [Moneuplotes crassus]|uniref:Uncharacterized protein n=2 Tax=Euplotes crassus TaxID=5936 RepID=A0AAD1UFW5_EUPCR|nr:unnamed protein product [Moneuplotes crassus]